MQAICIWTIVFERAVRASPADTVAERPGECRVLRRYLRELVHLDSMPGRDTIGVRFLPGPRVAIADQALAAGGVDAMALWLCVDLLYTQDHTMSPLSCEEVPGRPSRYAFEVPLDSLGRMRRIALESSGSPLLIQWNTSSTGEVHHSTGNGCAVPRATRLEELLAILVALSAERARVRANRSPVAFLAHRPVGSRRSPSAMASRSEA